MDSTTSMLDTNIFNKVLDGKILIGRFIGRTLLSTGVQQAELRATPDSDRRKALLLLFDHGLRTQIVPSSSFCFDIPGAGWGEAEWNDGSGQFQEMLARLTSLDQVSGRHRRQKGVRLRKNQIRDILIAETAIKTEVSLISADSKLLQVVREFGGDALSWEEI